MGARSRTKPSIDLRGNLECDGDFLLFLSGAYMLSAALFSAVDLELFDSLERSPKPVDGLARDRGVPDHAAERIVTALHAIGLLERDEDGVYRNTPLASRALVQSSPGNIRSFLLYQQRHMVPLFGRLPDALRSGRPQIDALYEQQSGYYRGLARDPAMLRLFLEAMNTAAVGVGRCIAQRVGFESIERLVDMGGGGGQVALELVQAVPHLRVTLVEQPEACAFAREFLAGREGASRIEVRAGDFVAEPLSDPFDAVLLGGVLADWDEADRTKILAHAYTSLRPGGTLLASETLLDDDGSGPLLPALLSLTMLVGMGGKNFTAAELQRMLLEAGFEQPRTISNRDLGVRDLVVATKPRGS